MIPSLFVSNPPVKTVPDNGVTSAHLPSYDIASHSACQMFSYGLLLPVTPRHNLPVTPSEPRVYHWSILNRITYTVGYVGVRRDAAS